MLPTFLISCGSKTQEGLYKFSAFNYWLENAKPDDNAGRYSMQKLHHVAKSFLKPHLSQSHLVYTFIDATFQGFSL